MSTFKTAAKAWVASLIPIVTAVLTDVTGAVDVDWRGYGGAVLVSFAQWVAVYLKSNVEVAD